VVQNPRFSGPQPPKFAARWKKPRKNHERIVKKWREMALFRGPKAPFRRVLSRSRSSASHSFAGLYVAGTRPAPAARSPRNRLCAATFAESAAQPGDCGVAGRAPIRREARRLCAPKTLRMIGPAEDMPLEPPVQRLHKGSVDCSPAACAIFATFVASSCKTPPQPIQPEQPIGTGPLRN